MTYSIEEIAERIRSLRSIMDISTEEMCRITGETAESYAEYEAGQKDFPFGFLYHCAEALNVDLVELLTGENPRLGSYSVVRSGHGLPIEREEGFEYFHLAPRFKDKLAEPFLVRAIYKAGAEFQPIEYSKHEGNEFDYVLDGHLRFYYEGGHTEDLFPGDAVYYNSAKPHGLIAIGNDCNFLAVVMKNPKGNEAE